MIDYGKEYNGHQVAKKIRTEDAGGGRVDKAGSLTQESERGSGGRTSNLFSADRVTYRERCSNGGNRNLSSGALRSAIGWRHIVAGQRRQVGESFAGFEFENKGTCF